MNEFYPLNRIFVHKRESYAPWGEDELFKEMKEIGEHKCLYLLAYFGQGKEEHASDISASIKAQK